MLTYAFGLQSAPGEVGETGTGDGSLEQVALPTAEEHGAADLQREIHTHTQTRTHIYSYKMTQKEGKPSFNHHFLCVPCRVGVCGCGGGGGVLPGSPGCC